MRVYSFPFYSHILYSIHFVVLLYSEVYIQYFSTNHSNSPNMVCDYTTCLATFSSTFQRTLPLFHAKYNPICHFSVHCYCAIARRRSLNRDRYRAFASSESSDSAIVSSTSNRGASGRRASSPSRDGTSSARPQSSRHRHQPPPGQVVTSSSRMSSVPLNW